MNRNKRTGTILLAIVLALGVSLPWGIGGVFAESAEQVGEYLTSLFEAEEAEETEEAKVMAAADQDKYIYFDLAAGNVNIGKTTYTGYVFVNGTSTKVTGTHTADNKYYVYQSNPNADQSSPAHPKNTGYASTDDRKNCRIPKYSRVQTSATGKKTPWTDYVTNNTDVYGVSKAWKGAAEASGRTATGNNITFANASDYTADVTIDNIWSTHHTKSVSRSDGGDWSRP